jgi:hypothetical protein
MHGQSPGARRTDSFNTPSLQTFCRYLETSVAPGPSASCIGLNEAKKNCSTLILLSVNSHLGMEFNFLEARVWDAERKA